MYFSRRVANGIAAVICFVSIAIAYFYMERYLVLNPCPLCYAQRIAFGALGCFFLLACVFPGRGRAAKLQGLWLFILSVAGGALSVRHLYLQNQPKTTIASCGQDFYALVENTPLAEAVKTMITGSGDCGVVQWERLGLSIPGWALVAFVALAVWAVVHNIIRSD